jgi:hypothetical protein
MDHKAYRDFVLARFVAPPELGGAALHFAEQDQDWQSHEALIIGPHPDLTPEQQSVIAVDYGMEDERLTLIVRRALKLYYLRMLHLDEACATPKIQQIIWINRNPIYLLPSQYD